MRSLQGSLTLTFFPYRRHVRDAPEVESQKIVSGSGVVE